MMLDSTLGKILMERVAPTLPDNTENTTMKTTTSLQGTSSEAEVRLVVRLFVEEHIVFNGKVEEVKQLESEEVSRIVSRIAWDSARVKCKPVEENHAKLCQDVTSNSGEVILQSNCPSCKNQPSDLLPVLREKSAGENTIEKPISLDSGSNIPESFNHNSDKLLLNERDSLFSNVEHSVIDNGEFSDCDKYRKKIKALTFDPICESTNQPSPKEADKTLESHNIQDEQEPNSNGTVKNATEKTDLDFPLCKESKNYDDYDSESHLITETINDCVNSVDIEIRRSINQEGVIELTPNQQKISDNSWQAMDSIMHEDDLNGSGSDFPNRSMMSEVERTVACSPKDLINQTIIVKQDNSVSSSKAYHKENFDDKYSSARKLDGCRRRNTGETGLSHKRIRRSSLKDHRKSHGPEISRSLSGEIDESPETMSEKSKDFARNSKIFAKWSDNHYYPGTILRPSKDRKFVVGFFDGAQRNVAETDLIPLCNIGGKQVRVSISKNYCVNAIVHDQRSPIDDQPMFDVEYQRDGTVRRCVPLRDIFLTAEQGAPLIHQPLKPDKNPDESMFAGVDLDNIVHVKRSRRLQEMEDFDSKQIASSSVNINTCVSASKRKRGNQYNMRNATQPKNLKTCEIDAENSGEKSQKRYNYSNIDQHRPANSCSPPENIKTNLHCPNSNPSSEGSNSTESSNTPNALEMGQEFYFSNSSPHRTETSLLL